MKVEFPKLTNDDMTLFYGQRDSLGRLNWQQANDTFIALSSLVLEPEKIGSTPPPIFRIDGIRGYSLKDTMGIISEIERKKNIEYNKISEKVYQAIHINSFGWINCDRFLAVQNKTDLHVNFISTDKIDFTTIYLVFNDVNSVMQSYYYKDIDGKISNEGFANIPMRYKVRLVAFAIKDKKV